MITYEEFFKITLLFIVFIIVLHFVSKTIINSYKQDRYKRQSLKNLEKNIKKRLEKANKTGGGKK